MGAALHVNNASGLTFNHAVREAPPETRSSEGGGVWAEYVPIWLGGRGDRPGFPIGPEQEIYLGG